MNYLITLLLFAFFVMLIHQIACGFPLISKFRQNKRQKRWDLRQKIKKENKEKIKLLNNNLIDKNEIETYIRLNKFNLPEDEEWKPLLPKMIKDLLAIGWTTDIPIYTKFKYGRYQFHISTSNQKIMKSATTIFNKYLDKYELD